MASDERVCIHVDAFTAKQQVEQVKQQKVKQGKQQVKQQLHVLRTALTLMQLCIQIDGSTARFC